MASKGKGGATVAAVAGLADEIARSLGLRIWDINFVKEGAEYFLRIFIDKDGGVGIEDCENFSRAIDGPLDELDPIEQGYCLEVSSPGIERSLTKPEHFTECIGQKVQFRMIRPVDGERDFKGVLASFDSGNVEVTLDNGKGFVFNKKEASFIKLDDFNM
ncbi:MAG: ribosome maturation factor RimP [Clostridia bacterium]|nr:ribosome maturation factor RimP [Clostridia bacterium]